MSDIQLNVRGFINLRGRADKARFKDAVRDVLGQALPTEPNTFIESGRGDQGVRRVYWLGPDEWLIETSRDSAPGLVRGLDGRLDSLSAAINDLGGGLLVCELPGPDAAELLSRGCTLDLHASVFPAGACAQTHLAKTNVLIACIGAPPVYEIIVRRSFSEYLLRWLRQTHLSLAGSASSSSTTLR